MKKVVYYNEGYLITAKNLRDFKDKFMFLSMEEGWKPDVDFLLIFNEIELSEINDVFKILLHYHVYKVLVINGASNTNVYTYNPFENYGCGKVFTRTISYGKCLEANITKSFFYKPVTGLRNCTFNVAFCDANLYVIARNNYQKKGKPTGVEPFIMQILTELEQFNVKYTYQFDPEEGSIIGDDMMAYGPIRSIQKGDVDIMMGGLILKHNRILAFSYLNGYYTYNDALSSILVTEQNPAVRVWYIIRLKIFDDAELERLRREAIPLLNELAMPEDAAAQATDQHPHVEAAMDLPVVVDSDEDEMVSHELEQMRRILIEAILETRSISLEN
ncbi:unnamed protein product [Parnassius apollo]|uniref:(apollo) hypothetical protein n=1 Tax=Parnassius apollo TaxID=110799 RepID=A0A8S3W2U8_PARAO|nr:unnamed protein product [Parnassius apollo]